jgi:Spy/CpxP family protein refolding chaperone
MNINTTFRRITAGVTLAVAPALLALGVAAASHADSVVPNPGPQIHAGQHYAGGANGTVVKPGTPEHHHHQKNK